MTARRWIKSLAAAIGFGMLPVIASATSDATATSGESATSSYLLGSNFQVNVTMDSSNRIQVSHGPTGLVVLETSGSAWLSVASGIEKRAPVSKTGGFTLKEVVSSRTTSLTITGCHVRDCGDSIHHRWGETSCESLDVTGSLGSNALPFNFTLTAKAAATSNQLRFNVAVETSGEEGINRLFFTHASAPDEQVLGFGTQYSAWDMKGRYVPILSTEQGIGRGLQPITAALNLGAAGSGGDWHTSYAPLPIYVTPGGRALALENSEYVAFDLKSHRDCIDVEVWAMEMEGELMAAESPLSLLTEVTAVTGRMALLPSWVQQGAVVGMEGGTAVVSNLTQALLAAGVPIAALWLQDWVGINAGEDGDRLWWNWEPDDGENGMYEGWNGLVDGLESEHGIRVMTYINPYFTNVSTKDTGYVHNYFEEGVENGFFVKTEADEPYILSSGHFDFSMLDLTNPQARAWLKEIVQSNMLRCSPPSPSAHGSNDSSHHALGSGAVYGWMNDFGEYLPFDSVLYSGEDASSYHNRYPEAWSSLVKEAVAECDAEGEVVFFSRSAALHSPKDNPLFWMGDQLVSWDDKDGIKTALAGMLTGGLTGHTLSHSDIGGFTVVSQGPDLLPWNYHYERSKELLFRWIELSAFSDVIFRTHPGSMLKGTVQVYDDADSMNFFATFARIHMALFDYRQGLIQDAANLGYPVTRAMFLHFPTDEVVLARENSGLTRQFMLGNALLVAPVLDNNARTVRAYLPEWKAISLPASRRPQQYKPKTTDAGSWVHLWSNTSYPAAAWCEVPAPLGQPGVFFMQGDPEGLALQEAVLGALKPQ